jgi:flagellar hook-length control protein FliK
MRLQPGRKPRRTAPAVPVEAVAVEIATRAGEGRRRFEIRLDPPELGRIDVRLDFARDGQLLARLVVDRAETLDLLRRDSVSLERALESAGLRTEDSGLQMSLRQQSSGQEHTRGEQPRPDLLIVPDEDLAVREAVQRAYGVLRGLGRGVDIRI